MPYLDIQNSINNSIEPDPRSKKFKSLKFPSELGTDEAPNFIRFEPMKFRFGATVSANNSYAIAPPTARPTKNSATESNGGLFDPSDLIDGIADNVKNIGNTVLSSLKSQTFAVDVPLAKTYGLGGNFKLDPSIFGDTTKTEPDKTKKQGSINLFLPKELNESTNMGYQGFQLRGSGVAAAQAGAAQDLVSSTLKAGAESLRDMLSDNRILSAADISAGRSINNFSYQTFTGVEHRVFSYSFYMSAKNEQESADIKLICDTFKYWALPKRTSVSEFQYYEIPCLWEINYYRRGTVIEFLESPKECFLTSVEVNYGENTNVHLYDDGAPMEVTLKVDFIEVETQYRGK